MKAWKIISGILSMLLSVVIAIISVLHIVAATVGESPVTGFLGLLAAFLLFLAGLISICTCPGYLGGNIATLIFYVLTLAACLTKIDDHPHLFLGVFWGGVCALVIFILCFFSRKKYPVDPARMAPPYGGQYYAPQGQPYQAPQYQQPPQAPQYPQQPAQPPQYQPPTQYPPQGGQGR
ncbi:MAG: hypothetical protein K6F67_01145 [Oscillospiraceae bacterium]|nr:hypothetical protein [Oscillospiraceae bacterium]